MTDFLHFLICSISASLPFLPVEWEVDVIIQDKLCSETDESESSSERRNEQTKMLDEICCSSAPLNDDNPENYLS